MTGWTRHKGTAVALPLENVDTDQLIPARFMSAPRSEGYGSYLLHDLGHDENGEVIADFPLNRHPDASVLVARRNFGCGSSREAAVYALVDHGICTVIAPSFGDIFAANAINNGLLPARVDADALEAVIGALGASGGEAEIDVESGTIRIAGHELSFHLQEEQRNKLANGWDDIDLTQSHEDVIGAFKHDYGERVPWARPSAAKNFAT